MKGEKVYNNECGFEVPSPHFPTYEELEQLAAGDRTVVNDLIESLTDYAIRETDWLIHTNPSARPFKDDLLSEALLALSEAVNEYRGRKKTPVQLVAHVKHMIHDQQIVWLNDYGNGPVRIPRSSRRRGETLEFTDLDDISLSYEDQGQADIIFEDYLHSLLPNDQEMLRMKLHGCTNNEIGEELNIDPRQINAKLKELLVHFWDGV